MSRNSPDANTNFYSNSLNQWQCIGPWDFDKDAASRSYAPGAAHMNVFPHPEKFRKYGDKTTGNKIKA